MHSSIAATYKAYATYAIDWTYKIYTAYCCKCYLCNILNICIYMADCWPFRPMWSARASLSLSSSLLAASPPSSCFRNCSTHSQYFLSIAWIRTITTPTRPWPSGALNVPSFRRWRFVMKLSSQGRFDALDRASAFDARKRKWPSRMHWRASEHHIGTFLSCSLIMWGLGPGRSPGERGIHLHPNPLHSHCPCFSTPSLANRLRLLLQWSLHVFPWMS